MNAAQPPADSTAEALPAGQPLYGFAKRYGTLFRNGGRSGPHIVYTVRTPAHALFEMRRLADRFLPLEAVTEAEFDGLLQATFEQKTGQSRLLVDNLSSHQDLLDMAQHLPKPEDLLESEDEAPIIRLINALLAEAVNENASDIHIESYENRMSVRFRIDGVLQDVIEPQREFAGMVISRLKVMAKLDIAEKRLPQDGRISLILGGRSVDIRVSTLPSGFGERVVLRILDKQANQLSLQQLGMNARELDRLRDMIARPHGIILVTGPTGSGKTTSLYAVLNRLNERTRNILTIEDPIEFYLDGIGQTQVNGRVDMTFARGLRAILRQDPDIVMVGEIRDRETAEIAVQASLTGHLVLSTLHTNTAVGAVTRLRDMGVESFLLASSLVGLIAQRLVRKLCPDCKQTVAVPARDLAGLGHRADAAEPVAVCEPVGCEQCRHSGFRGRAGLFEVVAVNARLRALIHEKAGEQDLEREARLDSAGIRDSALAKVLAGVTSIEEALRIIRQE